VVERAWALNGRAYLRARMHDLAGALADVREAEQLLGAPLDPAHPLAGEQLAAHLVMHENLAELHARAGEIETALSWEAAKRARARELPGQWQHGLRVFDLLRRAQRIREAIELAEQALATARARFDPVAEDRLLAELAVLRYQAGDAEQAYADASAALAMFRRIGGEAQAAVELSVAMAALRGRRVEAIALLEHVLDATTDVAARAELTAVRGWALAMHDRVDACEQAINDAIEQAVALGSAATLARVACAAGEACLALGRLDDAAQAFTQARELAATLEPADRLIALAGWLHTHPGEPAVLEDALRLLDVALAEPEVWWELPRLAAAVRAQQGVDAALPAVLARALANRRDARIGSAG
jgi:tetratricopeptide (TPR) repeat protein